MNDARQEVASLVTDVLAWLPRVTPEVAAELLVGCGFHDGQSDNLDVMVVKAVDPGRLTITLAGSDTPISLRRFRDGEFIDIRPGAPLATAMAASRTPAELRDEAEHLAVRRAGFEPGRLPSGDARRAVVAMVEIDAAGRVPDEAQRAAFYGAVRPAGDAGTARAAARLLDNALQRFEAAGPAPEDLHWRLAALLRQAGNWQAAVEAAEILYARPGLKEKTRLYLASTMAGSLLDLAGVRPTPALLDKAERALKVAWALNNGDESLRTMWRMLDRLRGSGSSRG